MRKDGSYLLEIENVPAFRAEDFMPPAKVAKANVRLIYLFVRPEDFWKHTGSRHSELYNLFVAKPKDLRGALSAIVSADDPPETKLRKLYARAQQVRNVSFEHKKTLQELGRLKRDRYIVAPKETLKRGYGIQLEITGLFVGLARAAGFETSVLSVATRDNNFFDPSLLAGDQLTGDVVAVRLGNEERFF